MVETIHGYTRSELLTMDVDSLRGILHERTHHTIEVLLYRILKGKLKKPTDFGEQAKRLLDIWAERELPTHTPDLVWCSKMITLAEKLNAGDPVALDTDMPEPFTEAEMNTVQKLLYGRRSIRQFTDGRR